MCSKHYAGQESRQGSVLGDLGGFYLPLVMLGQIIYHFVFSCMWDIFRLEY